MKRGNINFSYVPVEKLNRLTPNNHQGACNNLPISFFDLETLIESVVKTEKTIVFVLDQISDARNFGAIIRTAECTGVNGIIVQKAGSAPVNGDTVKHLLEPYLIFRFVKWNISKMLFFFTGIKTVATEKNDII
jgi:23S rRNA (guanosine2251-2'-O)-methyltransferase